MIKNKLKLNKEHDNYGCINMNFALGNGTLMQENGVGTMEAFIIQFEEMGNFQLEFVKAVCEFIEKKHVYKLKTFINLQEKFVIICDNKYNMSHKQFKKILNDLRRNVEKIVEDTTNDFMLLFKTKSKKEIKKHFEELITFYEDDFTD